MNELTMAQALNLALSEGMSTNPAMVILGEDVGRTGGVFRVTEGLQERFGSDRVIDTPVAESGIVGMAFGMAVAGLNPVAEMQFMGFSYPALDQIINHVARIRHRSRHRFTAPMVIRIAYGGGVGGAEHHSESMETLYAHIPGLTVVAVSRPYNAKGLLSAVLSHPDPVIFLEPIRLYRKAHEELPAEPYTIPVGSGMIERTGSHVTLVSYGAMMWETRQAADRLAEQGIEAEVIDLQTLSPVDLSLVVSSVEKTGRMVVIHEAPLSGGWGAEIAATVGRAAFYALESPIQRVTGFDTIFPLRRAERFYLPTVERILAAAEATLG